MESQAYNSFIDIIRRENYTISNSDQLNDDIANELLSLLSDPNDALNIMINFSLVNHELGDISFDTRMKVYWEIFNKSMYDNVYDRMIGDTYREPFLKCFLSSAIVVEIVKIQSMSKFINDNDTDNISDEIKQEINLLIDSINYCKDLVQYLYGHIKRHFNGDMIHRNLIRFFENNYITFVST